MPEKQEGNTKTDNPSHWQKGVSGNPKGRPRTGEAIAELTREFLEDKDPVTGRIRKLEILDRAYKICKDGEDKDFKGAAEFLYNRAYGKPIDPIELTGKDGGAIEFKIIPRDPTKGENDNS